MADVTINQLSEGIPSKNSAVIPYSDGITTLKTSPSGIVAASPGCLLQVKQAVRTSIYSLPSGDTWLDVPDVSVDITPRTLSSKFLLSWTAGAGTSLRWGQGTVGLLLKIVRTINNVSADVGVGDVRGTAQRATAGCFMVDYDYIANISGTYLDSPSIVNLSTPISYKLQAFKDGSAYNQLLGGTFRTGSYVGDANVPTILTIQEIAG